MRFIRLEDVTFGPVVDGSLEFSPGMNVFTGPNESGKSTWQSAIYAGLCGRKRGAGRSSADRVFEERHRPWGGDEWYVRCIIELDDGRTIAIRHELIDRVDCRAIDTTTGEDLSVEIQFDGTPDGSRFLGLNRDIMRSTLFVGQAETLAVLANAGNLQEQLQLAAASGGGDATAKRALDLLEDYRRNEIGTERAPTKPLRATEARLDQARVAFDSGQTQVVNYRELVVERDKGTAEVATVSQRMYAVRAAMLTQQLDRETERLAEVHGLAEEFANGEPSDPAEGDRREDSMVRALAEWDQRPDDPGDLPSPGVEQLQQRVEALPLAPTGDLDPAPAVQQAHTRLRDAQRDLDGFDSQVDDQVAVAAPIRGTSPSELRDVADAIERASRSDQPAPRSSRIGLILGIGGGMGVVAGGALVGMGYPVPGYATVAIGIIAAVAGLVPYFIRRELGSVEATGSQAAAARHRADELSLPEDPQEIRRIAITLERADAGEADTRKRRERQAVLEDQVATAREAFADQLRERGMPMPAGASLQSTYADYLEACRQRREQAALAASRPDLEHQLEIQRQLEEDHQRALHAIKAAETKVINVAAELELRAETAVSAAAAARQWLEEERISRQSQLDAWTRYQRLQSLLDGRTEQEWSNQRNELTSRIEAIPPHDALDGAAIARLDLDDEMVLLEEEHARLQSIADQAAGAVAQREPTLPDLAELEESVEREQDELERLQSSAAIIERTRGYLASAQDTIHRSIAPRLKEAIELRLPGITDDRYHEVTTDPETLEVKVLTEDGRWQSATNLSHGTTEQIFLLLRVALAEHLITGDERAPLVMDDVTVQSDPERTFAILEMLHDLSRERQVILFSQEPEVAEWARERLFGERDQISVLPVINP